MTASVFSRGPCSFNAALQYQGTALEADFLHLSSLHNVITTLVLSSCRAVVEAKASCSHQGPDAATLMLSDVAAEQTPCAVTEQAGADCGRQVVTLIFLEQAAALTCSSDSCIVREPWSLGKSLAENQTTQQPLPVCAKEHLLCAGTT